MGDGVIVQSTDGKTKRELTPIKTENENAIFRYLLVEYDATGKRIWSQFVASKSEISNSTDLFSMTGRTEGVTYYSPYSAKLKEGEADKAKRLIVKKNNKTFELDTKANRIDPQCSDGDQTCIEWYLITFNASTGEVVGESYLYTSCYPCNNQGGSGGGGSSSTSLDDLKKEMESGPVSITQSIGLISESAVEREKAYRWEMHRQRWGLWGFISHEKGIHKKVGSEWQWKSLEHLSVSKYGVWAGGVVSCTVNSAIPQVGTYNAGMQLNYTITCDAAVKGSPLSYSSNHSNNSPIWNVNQ